MTLEAGNRLGPYEIVELLGKGGMGEVYRARDTRLDRDVAVKVLPSELSEDETYRRRLEREAKTISQLQHPNVCTLYDVGSEGATQYLVMEYLEGETLEDRLLKGSLPIPDVLRIGVEIAEALEAAHQRGIVHRDLKPANVMLTEPGTKVLDFGLAKDIGSGPVDPDAATETIAQALTKEGRIVGTMPYMAPEQLQGSTADSRTDVWALGCLLYEMASGGRPFRGETQASLIGAIMESKPEPPSREHTAAPSGLDRIVKRCLEKDPERRWQSARDLGIELESLRSVDSGQVTSRTGRRKWVLAAAAVLVVLLGAAVWFGRSVLFIDRGEPPGDSSASVTETTMILVLPFDNLGDPGEASLAAGLTEELRTGLAGIEGVGVVNRYSSEQALNRKMSIAEMGADLGVHYVLAGTIQWAPDQRVLIRLELVRVSDQAQLWRGDYDRVIDHLFAIQSEISAQVATQLDFSLLRAETGVDSQRSRPAAAIRAYLKGRDAAGSGYLRLRESIEMFETAVSLDSGFALAWAWLSETHSRVFRVFGDHTNARLESARRAAENAVTLGSDLPETRRALGYLRWNEGDFDAGRREFDAALAGLPGDSLTVSLYAYFVWRTGDIRRGRAMLQRAITLDPLQSVYVTNLGLLEMYLRDYEEAGRLFDLAISMAPADTSHLENRAWNAAVWKGWGAVEVDELLEIPSSQFRWMRFWSLLRLGRYDEATALTDLLPSEGFVDQEALYPRAFLRARVDEAEGNTELARKGFGEARIDLETRREESPEDGRVLTTLGLVCAKLGLIEEAVRYGQQGVAFSGPSLDAYNGPHRLFDLAATYALIGDSDSALDSLLWLLENPTPYSVAWIEADPDFYSLRELPGYRRLMESQR